MEFRTPTVSPLRQRMLDDMRMRKLQPRTQAGYIRAVRRLAIFLERSPDTATADDLRRFQLHMVDQGASPITINATLTGLKFFFEITLSRGELLAKVQPLRVPQTLPVVLSQDEVARLLAAVTNLKHHTSHKLLKQLVKAGAELAKGHDKKACDRLGRFVKKVEKLKTPTQITVEQQNQLIADATRIETVLDC